MDHHSEGKKPFTRDLSSENNAKSPCNSALENTHSWKRDFTVGLENSLAYYQCMDLKLNPLLHSSKRLKDTLTEKRHQYKLDLNRSSVPLAATHMGNSILRKTAL